MHTPNPDNYRAWLGADVNRALFILVRHRNSKALVELSVTDYLEKMILHWWRNEFPNENPPFEVKSYIEDFEI